MIRANSVSSQKPSLQAQQAKAIKKIASSMEEQFLKLMIKEMRKSTGQELDQTSRFYQDMLDSEYIKTMTQNGGQTGIQEMITRQLLPTRKRQRAESINYKLNPYQRSSHGKSLTPGKSTPLSTTQ